MIDHEERKRLAASLEHELDLIATGMSIHLIRNVTCYLYHITDSSIWEKLYRTAKRAVITKDFKELHSFWWREYGKRVRKDK